METGPIRVDAGELTTEEIIETLRAGRRVIVTVELMGSSTDIALRYDGETYFCDTPTRLHRHRETDEMRTCIERMGYNKPAADTET